MSTHTIDVFHYSSETETFSKRSTQRQLGPREILVRTTHSGLCYTDVHAKESGCGLGHEGVGTIEEVGKAVLGKSIGQRVGWGVSHGVQSCGSCSTCFSGYRQYCRDARGFAYSDTDQGAFSSHRIIDADFAYLIPEVISSVDAGPFMCAGASVYEALDAAGTKTSDRVGVVGIGGLGHMAILFANAMGCGVTAFSAQRGYDWESTKNAIALGADNYWLLQSNRVLKNIGESNGEVSIAAGNWESDLDVKINVLLVCSNDLPDWERILPLLDRRATIVLMSITQTPLTIPYMPFILPGHRIIASTEASRQNHLDMLEFAARNKIKPWIEEFPMTAEGLAEAFAKLEGGTMRYRGVLAVQDEDSRTRGQEHSVVG